MDKLFDVFISYSSKDKVKADAICAHFEGRGIRCWYAPRDIKPGAEWAESIVNALENSKMLVLVFTGNANASQQVLREVSTAVSNGMPIVPIKFSEEEPTHSMKYYLATVHWLDAINEKQEAAIKLLGDRCELLLRTGSQNLMEESIEEEPEAKTSSIKVLGAIMIIGLLAVGVAVYFAMKEDSTAKANAAVAEAGGVTASAEEEESKLSIIDEFDKAINTVYVGSWEQFENLTEEECEKVYELMIIGDQIISPEIKPSIEWQWEDEEPIVSIYSSSHTLITDDVHEGTIENLDQILRFKNLEVLTLKGQPIESLEGIQELKHLRELDVGLCRSLKDITPAFECKELGSITAGDTRVPTIEGIGKLKNLYHLDLGGTYVKDLAPLEEVDFTYANEHKGLYIIINSDKNLEYDFLEKVEKFDSLSMDWADFDSWWPHIRATQMRELCVQGNGINNERLKEIAQQFPEIERLNLMRNPDVTDLTVLTDCLFLQHLDLTNDMEEAIASAEQLKGVEVYTED